MLARGAVSSVSEGRQEERTEGSGAATGCMAGGSRRCALDRSLAPVQGVPAPAGLTPRGSGHGFFGLGAHGHIRIQSMTNDASECKHSITVGERRTKPRPGGYQLCICCQLSQMPSMPNTGPQVQRPGQAPGRWRPTPGLLHRTSPGLAVRAVGRLGGPTEGMIALAFATSPSMKLVPVRLRTRGMAEDRWQTRNAKLARLVESDRRRHRLLARPRCCSGRGSLVLGARSLAASKSANWAGVDVIFKGPQIIDTVMF